MEYNKHFVTSDMHFGHKNIITYCPDSRGGCGSVESMNETLVRRFNSVVGENDHTYILGDFAFCKPEEAMEWMKKLNGYKTLIHGNHDRKLISSAAFQDPHQRKLAGLVQDTPYLVISRTVNKAKYGVVLFHFRIASWDGAHHGSVHLYGHEHGGGPVMTNRCQDVGVDTNQMYPYDLDSLVEMLGQRPTHKEGHHDGTRE